MAAALSLIFLLRTFPLTSQRLIPNPITSNFSIHIQPQPDLLASKIIYDQPLP